MGFLAKPVSFRPVCPQNLVRYANLNCMFKEIRYKPLGKTEGFERPGINFGEIESDYGVKLVEAVQQNNHKRAQKLERYFKLLLPQREKPFLKVSTMEDYLNAPYHLPSEISERSQVKMLMMIDSSLLPLEELSNKAGLDISYGPGSEALEISILDLGGLNPYHMQDVWGHLRTQAIFLSTDSTVNAVKSIRQAFARSLASDYLHYHGLPLPKQIKQSLEEKDEEAVMLSWKESQEALARKKIQPHKYSEFGEDFRKRDNQEIEQAIEDLIRAYPDPRVVINRILLTKEAGENAKLPLKVPVLEKRG